MNRREWGLAACASLLPTWALAQPREWPTKPLQLVVPFPAGSSPDMANRILANELTKTIGQAIVVENRGGANGITGTQTALRAPADGYTLISVNVGTLAINPFLFPKQKYDPVRDLRVVALLGSSANVLVVRPDLPAQSVSELIAYGKANPGKLTMASSGNGTTGHLSGELFKEMAGLFVVHVPYRGSTAAYTDLIAGRTDFMFDNLVSVGPYAKDGRVRLLAITDSERSDAFPQLPTMQQAGLAGYETQSWGGVGVPRDTPEPIVERLRQALYAANQTPSNQAFYKASGTKAMPAMTDAQINAFVQKEQIKWSRLIERSGAANS